MNVVSLTGTCLLLVGTGLPGFERTVQEGAASRASSTTTRAVSHYVLGPEDVVIIRATHVEEITDVPRRIASDGTLRLPMAGTVTAAGATPEQLAGKIADQLRQYVIRPEVSVHVVDFRSQPVSVLGAVRNPGMYQVHATKRLTDLLSLAGGLDPSAGAEVTITRALRNGPIPLDGATTFNGDFSVARVAVDGLLKGEHPEHNIEILADDVITVPRAELVYVMGHVKRAGGFPLNDHKGVTVLQAISMAGGFEPAAAPGSAVLLRRGANSNGDRSELQIDIKRIIAAKAPDIPLLADDVLFVPSSASKRAGLRAAEAAIQLATGVVIWRR